MHCHPDLAEGGGVNPEASWTVGKVSDLVPPLNNLSGMCKAHLFFL